MNEERTDERRTFDPGNYPALREFLPGYLHQDFREEYGSAAEAVNGFVSEASGDEILQVKEEWKKFRSDFSGRPLEEMRAALERLGSTWAPRSERDLQEVDEILWRAEA